MATAGRILIMPKGTWNAETTYENLDMVAHSGRAWLAKKVSVGIEPSDANAEFWHDFLGMDVFTEANPPTAAQVGAVSLYADPVLSKSTDWDNLESGTYRFSTWSGSGGVGYPPIDDVGICILFDTEAGRYMYCLGMNRIVSRYYESKTWNDWIEGYIPVTGGKLRGGITLENQKAFTSTDGTYNFQMFEYGKVGYLRQQNEEGTIRRALMMYPKEMADLHASLKYEANDSGVSASYNLFGQHNKPSGTYTGNGSATQRNIDIGGIGNTVAIYNETSGWTSAIITKYGGFAMINNSTSPVTLPVTECVFANGVLAIKSTSEALNASGKGYRYEVL